MLRAYVEIVPFGNEDNRRRIGEAHIINTGKGTLEKGDYVCRFYDDDGLSFSSSVEGFPRQKERFWKLLFEALKSHFKEKD